MKRHKNITRIKYLMIFSQILIAVFLAYWLTERYKYERGELQKDLQQDFESSEQIMLDTLIRIKMLNPLIKEDSTHNSKFAQVTAGNSYVLSQYNHGVALSRSHSDSSLAKDSIALKLDFNISRPDSTKSTKDSASFSTKKILQVTRNNTPPDKVLLEGVKIFLNIVGDSAEDYATYRSVLSEGLDSTVLVTAFTKEIASQKLKPVWFSLSDADTEKLKDEKIYFVSTMLNGNLGVAVKNYTLYILKKLVPNIFFSLLLLLVTATAFIISFSNLKKQLSLNMIRDDFVGNITHELKTPVATVKVALEALSRVNIKQDPEKFSEYLGMASKELERLDFLIEQVLRSSVLEYDPMAANMGKIDIREILQEMINTFQARFETENAKVSLEPTGTDFHITANSTHIKSIFSNLIDNSLKYTTGNPRINISLTSEKKEIIMAVSDEGIGIPDPYRKQVFEKFFRVPAENIHNVKGYGLGLHYVSMVVRRYGGSISVKNNENQGCTFTLRFPREVRK